MGRNTTGQADADRRRPVHCGARSHAAFLLADVRYRPTSAPWGGAVRGRSCGMTVPPSAEDSHPLSSEHILEILRPLLLTHSPTGHEVEAVDWVLHWMRERLDEVTIDAAGNVISRIPGSGTGQPVA